MGEGQQVRLGVAFRVRRDDRREVGRALSGADVDPVRDLYGLEAPRLARKPPALPDVVDEDALESFLATVDKHGLPRGRYAHLRQRGGGQAPVTRKLLRRFRLQ